MGEDLGDENFLMTFHNLGVAESTTVPTAIQRAVVRQHISARNFSGIDFTDNNEV